MEKMCFGVKLFVALILYGPALSRSRRQWKAR